MLTLKGPRQKGQGKQALHAALGTVKTCRHQRGPKHICSALRTHPSDFVCMHGLRRGMAGHGLLTWLRYAVRCRGSAHTCTHCSELVSASEADALSAQSSVPSQKSVRLRTTAASSHPSPGVARVPVARV